MANSFYQIFKNLIVLFWLGAYLFTTSTLMSQTEERDSIALSALLDKIDEIARNEPDSALLLAEEVLEGAAKINNLYLKGCGFYAKGDLLVDIGKIDQAVVYLDSGLTVFSEIDHKPKLAQTYTALGYLYRQKGEYALALKQLSAGKEIFVEIEDKNGIAVCYSRIGTLYNDLSQYEKAIFNQKKSLEINIYRKFKLGISVNWVNIASTFLDMEKPDSALPYLLKGLELKNELADQKGLAIVNSNLGFVYTELGQYDLAELHLKQGLKLAESIPVVRVQAISLTNLCYLYFKTGKLDKSIEEGKRSLAVLENKGFDRIENIAIEQLAYSYHAVGNNDIAYEYLERFVSFKDSLVPPDLAGRLIESEARMETEKKEAEIELLKSQDSLNQLKLEFAERSKWWVLALLGLTIVIGLVLYSRYRLKMRTHRELKELDQIKSRYFANLSHEFRTPLTLIIGPLENFIDGDASAKQKPEFQRMLRQARHLLNLNEQLLDLAKIESGTLKINAIKGNIIGFLRPIAESFRVMAEQKKINFEVLFAGEENQGAYDADKLEKIVNNLLSNAIKYTQEGGTVKFIAKALSGLELEIHDNGEGISLEAQEQVFNRFFRSDLQLQRSSQGTGIGLSLCRELSELMGGSIQLESELGKGTCFKVKIPFLLATQRVEVENLPLEEQVVTSENLASEEAPLLLIVDDNEDIRAFIREQFADSYRILEAADGQAGFEIATAELPDLVLSDLMMPILDGIEFCRALKADVRSSHIPFILLTALSSIESRIEGLETGADDYLNKPFNAKELQARVRNLIQQRRLLQERFAQNLKTVSDPTPDLPKAEKVFFQRFDNYVKEHLSDPKLSVENLGLEMGMSRVQLYRKMKAITGKNPSQMIRMIRLKKAAELLADGESNVAEAMYAAGFDNPSYFAKVFRSEYDCSPSQYRSQAG